ncbi:MAG: kinase [Magnetococcales bacterium]|nr:kinase [Magnetococcales bacterium]MBF0321405.1 kinase [Magnetococcales bacterium]
MIISRTPFRISFFGGGTDYPAWFREHGGKVLATAINKYCYISVRPLPPFFEHKSRVVYSLVEMVQSHDEIKHPAIRGILTDWGIEQGLEIHHDGDLPARAGLGSSSSFTVGLLHALHALQGRMVTKNELAREAIRIEQDVLQEHVGCQDQIMVAWGGFNAVEFKQDGTHEVVPIILAPERRVELESSLMLFFTGKTRFATDVAAKQIKNIPKKINELTQMQGMVDEAIDILRDIRRPIDDFGKLLHESWQRKRSLSDAVTTPLVDEIYSEAMAAGASGGKLLGAGGGGFMVFVVRPALRQRLRERLKNLLHVDFSFNNDGSKIIVFNPEDAVS